MSKFWSPFVKELVPYVPGEQPKMTRLVKLNTNENPYGPSPKALAAIREQACDDLRLYPDPECAELKQAIAEFYGVKAAQVFVRNELRPLQERLKEMNHWIDEDVIKLRTYSLE